MFESCTYPKVTAHVTGSAVQKVTKGGHGLGLDGVGVARLGVKKTSGRLMQQRKANGVVDVLLAREQRGRANNLRPRAGLNNALRGSSRCAVNCRARWKVCHASPDK